MTTTLNTNADASATTSILLIDDHPIIRSSLRELIPAQPGLEICAETGSLNEAYELITSLEPDIALVDIMLEDGIGLELIKRLANSATKTRFLVLSAHHDAIMVRKAKDAGAAGFISKQSPIVDIIQGIRTVQEGQAFFTPASLTEPGGSDKDSDPTKGISSLTNREMQVYELIGEGLGTSAIAKRLNLSVKTIESHKENIKNKLQVHSASELLRHAMQWAMGI